MEELPEELLVEIFQYISLRDWTCFYRTCKSFVFMNKYRYNSSVSEETCSYSVRGIRDGYSYFSWDSDEYGYIYYNNGNIVATHLIFSHDEDLLVLINDEIYYSANSYEKLPLPQLRVIERYSSKCLMTMPILKVCSTRYSSPNFVEVAYCFNCRSCRYCGLVCDLLFNNWVEKTWPPYCTGCRDFGCSPHCEGYCELLYDWNEIVEDAFIHNPVLYELIANITYSK
jgi:hypothetical protein